MAKESALKYVKSALNRAFLWKFLVLWGGVCGTLVYHEEGGGAYRFHGRAIFTA